MICTLWKIHQYARKIIIWLLTKKSVLPFSMEQFHTLETWVLFSSFVGELCIQTLIQPLRVASAVGETVNCHARFPLCRILYGWPWFPRTIQVFKLCVMINKGTTVENEIEEKQSLSMLWFFLFSCCLLKTAFSPASLALYLSPLKLGTERPAQACGRC